MSIMAELKELIDVVGYEMQDGDGVYEVHEDLESAYAQMKSKFDEVESILNDVENDMYKLMKR